MRQTMDDDNDFAIALLIGVPVVAFVLIVIAAIGMAAYNLLCPLTGWPLIV